MQQQNAGYQEQIRSLTAANTDLQGKLKEALSVQPAAVNPDDLAKAQAKIVALQKERDLLAVALEQEKADNASAIADAKALTPLSQKSPTPKRLLPKPTAKEDPGKLAAAKEAAACGTENWPMPTRNWRPESSARGGSRPERRRQGPRRRRREAGPGRNGPLEGSRR